MRNTKLLSTQEEQFGYREFGPYALDVDKVPASYQCIVMRLTWVHINAARSISFT
jgi:hypothetical protein